jgi:hypothetical protein
MGGSGGDAAGGNGTGDMMNLYKCIKTFIMEDEQEAFIEGKVYEGEPGATPSGQRMVHFIDEQGCDHLMSYRLTAEHFALERVI